MSYPHSLDGELTAAELDTLIAIVDEWCAGTALDSRTARRALDKLRIQRDPCRCPFIRIGNRPISPDGPRNLSPRCPVHGKQAREAEDRLFGQKPKKG